ncbi:MAG: hypothetical protein H6617_00475 [Bdellovibrionaceae bacterium]|nr:hypothetical protein [Bdellovibrionales bacterium]MCB9253142.1 hypothetical protein [Pseudobdellovibrionaceae bacterium]
MGKFKAIIVLVLASVASSAGAQGLDGLLGKQTDQRRGAFNDSLAAFNNSTNPNSLNNIYQSPQQAFISNLMQSTQAKLPERRDPSEITKQFEEGRKSAEESFKSLQEQIQSSENAKLDQLSKLLGVDDQASKEDNKFLEELTSLVDAGRGIGAGTSASAQPILQLVSANTQSQIQALLVQAQVQVQLQNNAPQTVVTSTGDDFILGIEQVGASMAARGISGSPFAATAALREARDVAGKTDAFTPDTVDAFNRTPSDPHFGHNHGSGDGHSH